METEAETGVTVCKPRKPKDGSGCSPASPRPQALAAPPVQAPVRSLSHPQFGALAASEPQGELLNSAETRAPTRVQRPTE